MRHCFDITIIKFHNNILNKDAKYMRLCVKSKCRKIITALIFILIYRMPTLMLKKHESWFFFVHLNCGQEILVLYWPMVCCTFRKTVSLTRNVFINCNLNAYHNQYDEPKNWRFYQCLNNNILQFLWISYKHKFRAPKTFLNTYKQINIIKYHLNVTCDRSYTGWNEPHHKKCWYIATNFH
jgi:hypothetical protein